LAEIVSNQTTRVGATINFQYNDLTIASGLVNTSDVRERLGGRKSDGVSTSYCSRATRECSDDEDVVTDALHSKFIQ
jgi:hypothetical protein